MSNRFGFSGNSNFFQKWGARIDNGLLLILGTLGAVLLTIGGAYASTFDFGQSWEALSKAKASNTLFIKLVVFNPYTALASGAILLAIGSIGTYKDQSKQKKTNDIDKLQIQELTARLENQNQKLESAQEDLHESGSKILSLHSDLVKTWLKGVFKHLKLKHSDRVTIYYEYQGAFHLLQRFSKNPAHEEIHRQKFPLNHGVISTAWKKGVCIEKSCPSFQDDSAGYEKFMSDTYQYDVEKIKHLTMKSCRYYARTIVDADRPIGVIVFESESTSLLDGRNCSSFEGYCREHQSQMSQFVRDGLMYDKEVKLKMRSNGMSPEDQLLAQEG